MDLTHVDSLSHLCSDYYPHLYGDSYLFGDEIKSITHLKRLLDVQRISFLKHISDLRSQKEETEKELLAFKLENLKLREKIEEKEKYLDEESSAKNLYLKLDEAVNELKKLKSDMHDVSQDMKSLIQENSELSFQFSKLKYENIKLKESTTKQDENEEMLMKETTLKEVNNEVAKTINDLSNVLIESSDFKRDDIYWKSTNDIVVAYHGLWIDTLDCPVMSTGVYTWRIRVISTGMLGRTSLGVISSKHDIDYEEGLGYQPGTWAYDNDGEAYYNSYWVGRYKTFGDGSIIKFILDLTDSGTLSVAVDENPEFTIFREMKSNFNFKHSAGFIPAVDLYEEGGEICFLGFENNV